METETQTPGGEKTTDDRKMVPESDLIAVKRGLEKQVEDVKSASAQVISDLKSTADKHYQSLLQEQTAKTAVEEELKKASAKVADVEKLQTDLTNATTSREQLGTELLGLKRSNLSLQYGVTDVQLEGKSLEQLSTLEDALKLVGPSKGTRNYDVSGGGGGSADGTPFAAEIAELAEAKSKK